MIFSRASAGPAYRAEQMYDLAAIAILIACFVFFVLLLELLRAGLMSAANIFGLVVSLLVLAYLVYALFRGERF